MNINYLFIFIAITAIILVICPAGAGSTDAGSQADTVEDSIVIQPLTITALGDGSYFRGEEITFSGVNTESDKTFLFICGPNLNPNGQKFDEYDKAAVTGDEDSFAVAEVDTDSTWKYALDTHDIDFDPGTYTIYAVSEPNNKTKLSNGIYGTVSIVIKKPFITAKVSEPDITAGEDVVITGTAEGSPDSVGIWVFGFDYWNGAESGSMVTVAPEDDASFEYVIKGEETANMDSGEYFVVVQHPMYNNILDIIAKPGPDENSAGVFSTDAASENSDPLFFVAGSYALRGADAADALVEALNLPAIDDYSDRCTFVIEEKQSENNPETPTPDETSSPGLFEAFMNFLTGILG